MVLRPLFCILSVLFFWLHSEAGTIRRVPQQYKTIQVAINATRIGDTVLVDHGIYYENVRINKNIVVASRFIFDPMRSR